MFGQRRIAVTIATANTKDRRIVRGILKYAHHQDDWELHPFYRPLGADFPLDLLRQFDGVIARVDHPDQEQALANLDIPAVRVSAFDDSGVLPSVLADFHAAGAVAADHLIEIGLKNFAYHMYTPRYSGQKCREGFVEHLASQSLTCHFPPADLHQRKHDPFIEFCDNLVRWIDGLPKPVGIFCSCDNDGRSILSACAHLGINKPEIVSVVAANNDDMICELCKPKLSSIDLLHENVGYNAAEILDNLMQGRQPEQHVTLVQPGSIIVRESTNTLAINDPLVRDAIQFIRTSVAKAISVDDVIVHTEVSRATLDRRFNAAMGHTVAHAIRQSRIQRAKDLLAKTEMALPDIAVRTGFRYQPRLSTAFKEATGQTPREYRQCRRT